jgi:2'-5' RNA ligase
VPAVVAAVEQDVARAPFTLTFGGIGVFPPRGKPSVLWLGVSGGAGEAIALQQELATRMERLGIPLERRPFHPHLTLARWRESRTTDRLRALNAATDRTVARVHVDHATLYQSRLSPAGPAYSVVARVTLSARASE